MRTRKHRLPALPTIRVEDLEVGVFVHNDSIDPYVGYTIVFSGTNSIAQIILIKSKLK